MRNVLEDLERFARTDQDTACCGNTAAPDQRQRRGHAEGARIAHHQHGNGGIDGAHPMRLAAPAIRAEAPEQERSEGNDENGWHVVLEHPVHQHDDAGLHRLGFFDMAGDLMQETVLADARCLD